MPPKASMDPETLMYYYEKSDRAAKNGEYLPTLEDLYCGISFFSDSVAADAKEWSAHIIPYLAQKGQKIPRNKVQLAIERLTVRADLEDLKSVHDEIEEYRIPPEMLALVASATRRLTLYRVARGDQSMEMCLVDDLMLRIRWLTWEASGLGRQIS